MCRDPENRAHLQHYSRRQLNPSNAMLATGSCTVVHGSHALPLLVPVLAYKSVHGTCPAAGCRRACIHSLSTRRLEPRTTGACTVLYLIHQQREQQPQQRQTKPWWSHVVMMIRVSLQHMGRVPNVCLGYTMIMCSCKLTTSRRTPVPCESYRLRPMRVCCSQTVMQRWRDVHTRTHVHTHTHRVSCSAVQHCR